MKVGGIWEEASIGKQCFDPLFAKDEDCRVLRDGREFDDKKETLVPIFKDGARRKWLAAAAVGDMPERPAGNRSVCIIYKLRIGEKSKRRKWASAKLQFCETLESLQNFRVFLFVIT